MNSDIINEKESLELDNQCQHRYFYDRCAREQRDGVFCEVGRRKRTYFVLSGSVICVWPALEEILGRVSSSNSHHRRMQIIRVHTEGGQRIVGEILH